MKIFFPAFLFLLLSQAALAQDTIRFQLCSELWKDARLIKGTTLTFQPINPSFPYPPMIFALDTSQHCADVTVVISEYLPGTTFSYNGSLVDTGYLNGVTIVDMCMIANHIVGIAPLPSPYAMIAADANESSSITTFDIVEIKKLIQGIYGTLPNSKAWYFLPDYYQFPNPNNPFGLCSFCPTSISMSELMALNGGSAKVIGMKIGDVNGDVRLNGEPFVPSMPTDSLTLLLPQGPIAAGIPVVVPLKFDKDVTIASLQIYLSLDPALTQYFAISDGAINAPLNTAFYDTLTGKLNLLSFNFENEFVPAGEPLFYIHLKALENVDLKDVLKLLPDDADVKNFAIGNDCGPYYSIGATYSGSVATHSPLLQGMIVHPPSPNPFDEQTFINIELESDETAFLEVIDLTGRIVYSAEKNLSAGNYRWEIPAYAVVPGSLAVWRLQVGERMVAGKLVRK